MGPRRERGVRTTGACVVSRPVRLAAIRKIIEGLVELDAEIARLAAIDGASDVYSAQTPPPRVSSRTFREACRSGRIPGARKEGKTWFCDRAAWHAAREVKRARSGPQPSTDVERADAMIREAGFRLTRR